MIHLQRLLLKKQDPVSHQSYLAVLGQAGWDTSLASYSWNKVTEIVTNAFSAAAAKSNFVKQAFEGEYPKLVTPGHKYEVLHGSCNWLLLR